MILPELGMDQENVKGQQFKQCNCTYDIYKCAYETRNNDWHVVM